MVDTITKDNFEEKIKNGLVIIKVGADFCGPCRQMKPILEEFSENNKEVLVGDIDMDVEQELGMKLGVRSIPHTFIFKNGEKVDEFIGVKNTSELSMIIDKNK